MIATATVGAGGWVDLPEPIVVRAGEAFIAIAEPGPAAPSAASFDLSEPRVIEGSE